MIGAYQDLPLARDAANKFLPWTVGFMVFIATLALAATLVLATAGNKWQSGLIGAITVQVLPLAEGTTREELDKRTEKAVALLRKTPGIASAVAIEEAKLLSLLEPWLGPGVTSSDLPLPRLIDVRLVANARVDLEALSTVLVRDVPGSALDDHGVWMDRLRTLAQGLEGVAIFVMALIAFASIATVVFTTRTGLAVHRDVVELLHLIGARDEYIAREFQVQAFWLAVRGALVGFSLAVIAIIVIGRLSEGVDESLMPDFALTTTQWALLPCLPVLAILIGTLTARVTVLRSIGRWL